MTEIHLCTERSQVPFSLAEDLEDPGVSVSRAEQPASRGRRCHSFLSKVQTLSYKGRCIQKECGPHTSPMISFWATFLDRKASIQGQTIHPITMWVAGHPLRLGTMPLGLRRRLHQPPQVCSEAFEEPLKVLFTLLGIFFFFLMEVDNMKPFYQICIWEILCFSVWGFYQVCIQRPIQNTCLLSALEDAVSCALSASKTASPLPDQQPLQFGYPRMFASDICHQGSDLVNLLPALNTQSRVPLKGHWALPRAFQTFFFSPFYIWKIAEKKIETILSAAIFLRQRSIFKDESKRKCQPRR